jgi:dTDP-4-amino-4,6-dideoxygalactose transaminase
MTQIPVFKPLIEDDEIRAATEALEMGWLGMGSYVRDLEAALSDYLGLEDRHLACVNTGHSALHLALVLAGVGPGDEVITPSFGCVSDFQAIVSTGADIVLCDALDDTLSSALCDYERADALAAKHGLRVVHDAAHGFGCRHKGRMVGSFSDMTMLSFDPVKTLTCLDAGALIVRTEEELERIHELRILGMGQPPAVMYQNKRAWTFHVDDVGYRYHLLNLHAAIGLAQLRKMDRISETRRTACRHYMERLAEVADIRVPRIDLENITPFIFYIRVPGEVRDEFRIHLGERGVDTGVHWQPGHHFKLLDGCRRSDLSVSDRAGREIVTLPLHSAMREEHLDAVADAVIGFFRGERATVGRGATALEQAAAAE